ncbi:energy transducer TonB [Luteimonas kalidii]|uniref:energy transducer TonB n=1 Tax=Luteimonas kalidii TaxID=3042025 RepID=UPI003CE50A70
MTALGWLLTLALVGSGSAGPCAGLDPELLVCPAPEAPRITELTRGEVTLELSVAADGSVTTSRVQSASGHPAWIAAAQQAVLSWRYRPGSASSTRTVPFDFKYADD